MKKNLFLTLLLNLGLCIVYIFAGKLGLSLAFANPSATVLWAPTGIALAALLIFGRKVIPAIFIGAFFVNLTTAGTILTSLGIALGNTLEGVVGAYLVKKFANGIHAFETIVDIFKFTFLAGILSTTVSANIGVVTLLLGHLAQLKDFWSVWITWWLGDMGGNLVIAPLLLVWWTHHRIPFGFKQGLNYFFSLLSILLVSGLIFSGVVPYPYLYIPIAVWIAFWFGRRGATIATIIVSVITINFTLSGMGPFAGRPINEALIQLQLFINIFSLTALIFAATVLEIRKNEKTLAFHEQHFQALIEKSFDAIFLVDATSIIQYASNSVTRLLGYTPQELKGMTGFDIVAPEDKKMAMTTLAKIVLKPGRSITVVLRLICKNHIIIWVEATGTNLLLEPGVNAVVVNFHDITDRKLAQDKLLEEKLEDEAMLASIGDGIIATDNAGKITIINQAACEMLGWKEKEVMQKSIIEIIPLEDASGKIFPVEERPIKKVLSLGKKIITSPVSNYYYVRKDGTKFPVRFILTPIILDDKVVGTIEVFHDITREKEIDKAKTEFVSVASHQLRTPLATINWYLEELLRNKTTLDAKQSSYMAEVYFASQRMIALINSLLNASRIELGTFTVEPVKVAVVDIVKQVLQDLQSQITGKKIIIKQNLQKNIPLFSADAKLFTIIIQNLVANAIKYSKAGSEVEIKLFFNNKELLLSVSDHGCGIPQSQQAKIFSKLFRADNARMLEPEGTGLGLYIVRSIIETTGGRIWFVSEENKGSTFSVAYPITGMRQKKGEKQLI